MTRYRIQSEQPYCFNPYERIWYAQRRGWSTLWLWADIDGHWEGYDTEDEALQALGAHVRRAAGITNEQFHAMARAALRLD